MAKVEAAEIEPAIVNILANAATGKGTEHGFLTAYQILSRLPDDLQERLQDEYGPSGRHGGRPFGAATRVAQVAAGAPGVEKRYLDTRGLQFDAGQEEDVGAGFGLCALFRLPP